LCCVRSARPKLFLVWKAQVLFERFLTMLDSYFWSGIGLADCTDSVDRQVAVRHCRCRSIHDTSCSAVTGLVQQLGRVIRKIPVDFDVGLQRSPSLGEGV
jgi:hypothetical protein